MPVALWNDREQRVRSSRQFPQYSEINAILSDLAQNAEKIYLIFRSQGKDLSIEQFKIELDKIYGKHTTEPVDDKITFEKFCSQFIQERIGNPDYSRGSIVVYKNCVKHTQSFAALSRRQLDFLDFDYAFFADFTNYLFTKNFSKNYIHKIVSTLKTILREADKREISPALKYKSDWVQVSREEPAKIYLTEEELDKIAALDLSTNARLDRVRDLFLLGCFTGLRYSDYRSLKLENLVIKNGRQYIDILTQKTRQRVVIPLRKIVVDMLQKYNGVPPQGITNQKANEYLKELGTLSGLDQAILVTSFRGGKRIDQIFKKYQLITTHTARRSFASNAFKAGVPVKSIMQLTGHKTEKEFYKYIRLSGEEHAELIAENPFFK
ncbi:MAG: tyrosine-type recombinase/integrase [Saprospiraceae bacterium]|nr:tyrosine-type recombinase/integrase [Saprospiraceae bacterium]